MSTVGPWCKDYATGVTTRILALVILWLWYAITPYELPLNTLWIITATLLLYSIFPFRRQKYVLGALIIVAAVLNTLLIVYLSPGFNLLITLLITAILLYDIVETPQRAIEE